MHTITKSCMQLVQQPHEVSITAACGMLEWLQKLASTLKTHDHVSAAKIDTQAHQCVIYVTECIRQY